MAFHLPEATTLFARWGELADAWASLVQRPQTQSWCALIQHFPHPESQVGYISALWGAVSFGPISTKIGKIVGAEDVIIQCNFSFNILGVSDLQGVKISVFPLTLLVIITTVLPLPCSLWCNYRFPWQPFPGIHSLPVTQKCRSCRQQRVCHTDHRDQQQRDSVTDWHHLKQLHGQHHWHTVAVTHHCRQLRQQSVLLSGCWGLDHHVHQPVTI